LRILRVSVPRWLGLGLLLLSGACTTSRAVWLAREGWQAESRGQLAQALSCYEAAAAIDRKQVAARLNWIRLRAQSPESRDEAGKALDGLLQEQPDDPRVAAFAATWALWQGDAGLARQRLERARTPETAQGPEVASALQEARLQLAAALGRWPEAWQLAGEVTPSAAQAVRRAAVAWRAGHRPEAEAWLTRASGGHGDRTRAVLLAAQGRHADVLSSLEGVPDDVAVLGLRARALLGMGRPAEALAWATQAARLAPADAGLTELWAVTLLVAQQPSVARDLLVGLSARGAGWTVWHHLGLAHLALGDGRAALEAFQSAVALCGGACPASQHNVQVLAAIH
jgi:tetratricopeptide (TPR) repeat protein